jgi:hypothetical protein
MLKLLAKLSYIEPVFVSKNGVDFGCEVNGYQYIMP